MVLADDGTIYAYHQDEEKWIAEYNFPEGTSVNVLFFDDRLVGTGIGLYDQPLGENTEAYDDFGYDSTESMNDDWMYHDRLGVLFLVRYPWVYQSGMGWFYVEDAGVENLNSWGYFDKSDFP